jgi:hypothetical protein
VKDLNATRDSPYDLLLFGQKLGDGSSVVERKNGCQKTWFKSFLGVIGESATVMLHS